MNPDDPRFMNEQKKLLIDQIEQEIAFQNNLMFHKGKEDLYFFNKFVLDVEKDKQELGPFHRELCDFVTNDRKKKKLILIPRGHLKSTLITIGYPIFRIVNDKNVRVLILNATWQMAVDFLTEIKRHLQANEKLIEVFGPLAEGAEEWSQDRITLKRDNHNIKGPTVWATGVESNLVGSHPDLIIMDDLVNRDNSATREQVEKVILRYKDALDLLEPGGQLIVIGTRWREDDFYSWIMDKEQGVTQNYDVMVRTAYEGSLKEPESLKLLWPEKFTPQIFEDLLSEKGWYEFSAQYLNNPVPDEAATFKRMWLQRYDREDIRGKDMMKAVLIDPAISIEKDADYTAIVVVGVDQFGNIFVLDLYRGHYTPQQIIELIFDVYELWHPNVIGLETIAYQKALAYSLREEMIARRRNLPITELRSHDQSKDQRIKGLQPLYENKKVWHPKGHKFTPYLEEELLSFPRAKHDDLIDALSFALDIIVAPRKKTHNRYHARYLY